MPTTCSATWRRRRFMETFLADPERLAREVHDMERLNKMPKFIRDIVGRLITRKMKKIHFGQIVPIEDIEQIFSFVKTIVRVACICRKANLGQEKRYCYGVSWPPTAADLPKFCRVWTRVFSPARICRDWKCSPGKRPWPPFTPMSRKGLCHSVWTFHTPFIGGICNCDRSDCMAMRCTVTQGVPVMFRGEYVAQVDPDNCASAAGNAWGCASSGP